MTTTCTRSTAWASAPTGIPTAVPAMTPAPRWAPHGRNPFPANPTTIEDIMARHAAAASETRQPREHAVPCKHPGCKVMTYAYGALCDIHA